MCRCEADSECLSGLCLDALCANPDHDVRLTPSLATQGSPVRPLCPGFDRSGRLQDSDCADVLAFLESAVCSECDEASVRLCGCRTGDGLHECLLRAARDSGEGDPTLCAAEAEGLDCDHRRGPAGAPCGADSECRSGVCLDEDPDNNSDANGDDPRDWRCADLCATDRDCLDGWVCDVGASAPARATVDLAHLCVRR